MLHIFYQNVNRIRSKLTDLYLNATNLNYDIICLTETNFNGGVFDGEILDNRYNVFRRDRQDTTICKDEGGGVLIATRKDLNVLRQTAKESSVEDVWISIIDHDHKPTLNICVCYLPQYLTKDELSCFYDNLQVSILNAKESESFLIVGDFNTRNLTWTRSITSMALAPSDPLDFKARLLMETLSICNLTQFQNIPNHNNVYLDLVLSTIDNIQVYGADALTRLDRHHPAFVIDVSEIRIKKPLTNKNEMHLNFHKCDFSKINNDLHNVKWNEVLCSPSLDESVRTFYSQLNYIIKKHTPLTKSKDYNFPIWYSPALRNCLEEKNRFHRQFKMYGNPRDYDIFSLLRARCKRLTTSCYRNFVSSVEDSLDNDIKGFWRFINSKKGHVSIPQTVNYCQQSSSDGVGICELFSKYFGSVLVRDDCSENNLTSDCIGPFDLGSGLANIEIKIEDILLKIKQLDSNKGSGPDGIPTSFIKMCGEELSIPLVILYNRSLRTGIFPIAWKTAHIIPVLKSGDKSNCENYRPISILSCIAKLFESLVYNYIFCQVKPYLSDKQHGFIKGRSTISNLLEYKHFLCSSFAVGGQVDAVYTDFSKAFDKVNHTILCHKVSALGIHGSLLRWLKSYLQNRSQLVAIKGFISSPASVTSGVPQGSHLGPLLFIIFINDLVSKMSSHCLLYADDLKVFSKIDNVNDCIKLQKDLQRLSEWCSVNKMYLNVSKCFFISFTKKHNKIIYTYTLDNIALDRRTIARDLGVLFDAELSFRQHYEHITKRSRQLLGFIIRNTKDFKKPGSLIYLFQALVRTVLEYGCQVWSPFYAVHTNNIDSVQNKMLKILSYRVNKSNSLLNYEQRLNHFKLISLENRRKVLDLKLLHKILHSKIDSPFLLDKLNLNCFTRTRTYRPFHLHIYRNNTSFYNPISRMCRLYNDLSSEYPELDIYEPKPYKFIKLINSALS